MNESFGWRDNEETIDHENDNIDYELRKKIAAMSEDEKAKLLKDYEEQIRRKMKSLREKSHDE